MLDYLSGRMLYEVGFWKANVKDRWSFKSILYLVSNVMRVHFWVEVWHGDVYHGVQFSNLLCGFRFRGKRG